MKYKDFANADTTIATKTNKSHYKQMSLVLDIDI
jgi:predicted secreted acid phosphatase